MITPVFSSIFSLVFFLHFFILHFFFHFHFFFVLLLSDRHVSDNCVQHMLLSCDVFLAGLQAAVLSINNATSTGANV